MAKASGKSSARLPLTEARERAAKRLGIDDLDYAKKQLHERLKTAKFGRDWGALDVRPAGIRFDDLWQDSYWVKDWQTARASKPIVAPIVADGSAEICFEQATVYGIWIAPAIVASLPPAVAGAPKPKRKRRGSPETYDIPLIKRAMRQLIGKRPREAVRLDGKGGLFERLRDLLGDDAVPGRARLYKISESVFQEKQSTN
jgi:hypothetical protein